MGPHQHYHKQERTIISKSWRFVPPNDGQQKKVYTLNAGTHQWPFELPLPGDLPQSLEAEGGRVNYRLKAIVERPTFVHNIVKKRPIQIVRCFLPSDYELSQSLEIHNTWSEKMVYDITLPSKVYAHGETIPMKFNVQPIASNLSVRLLSGSLKEYCTYTANERSKTDTRVVRTCRVEKPFEDEQSQQQQRQQLQTHWSKVVPLQIPERSPLVFCDAENDMIRIRHKLKFVISLINSDGHLSELRCSVPITIVDFFVSQGLPSYDETWRSVPYDRSVWEVLRTRTASVSHENTREPVTIQGRTRALSVSSHSSIQPSSLPLKAAIEQQQHNAATEATPIRLGPSASPMAAGAPPTSGHPLETNNNNMAQSVESASSLWWNGMELSRVPSYHTAAQQEPASLSSSLPPYDSLSMSPRWTR